MSRYMIAGAVLLLLIVVGGIFVLIGVLGNSNAGDGSNPTNGMGPISARAAVR